MTEKPLVSVIINCYNGEKYLREAIDSVMAQTYENWELVFWDNQSTDSTREIVESYKNPKIKYFYAQDHTPLGEARNLAVEKANGEYINFLDADDVWSANKLEEQIKLIVPGEVELVYTPYKIIAGENPIPHILKRYMKLSKKKNIEGEVYGDLLKDNNIIFSSVLLKKAIFKEIGGVNTNFQQYEDWELLLKVSLISRFACAHKASTSYRIHGNNNTIKNGLDCLYEMRDILNELPSSIFVSEARRINETRIACHLHIKEGNIIQGLTHVNKEGSFSYLLRFLLKYISQIAGLIG